MILEQRPGRWRANPMRTPHHKCREPVTDVLPGRNRGTAVRCAAGSRLGPPKATVFGKDAYPTLDTKAAALLHSLARNHALIDGNKRLALAALIAFYGLNGRHLTVTNNAAYDLVMSVASGQLDTADDIAAILQSATQPRV
jgi:death-on-curing protein